MSSDSTQADSPVIEIYHRPLCGFCAHAFSLLEPLGHPLTTYDIWAESGRNQEMLERANGQRTVPQIFVNGTHIGGCDDLIESLGNGRFMNLLNGDQTPR